MCLEVRYTHKHRQQHWHAPWPNIIKLTHLSSWHIWLAGSQTEVRHYSVPSMVGALFCCHQQRNIVWTDVWIFWWADKNKKKDVGGTLLSTVSVFCFRGTSSWQMFDRQETKDRRQGELNHGTETKEKKPFVLHYWQLVQLHCHHKEVVLGLWVVSWTAVGTCALLRVLVSFY